MAVFVDTLRETNIVQGWRYTQSCHLGTDGDIIDLHIIARALGMKREWFQDHPRHPHYDLTKGKRIQAINLGIETVSRREFIRRVNRTTQNVLPYAIL